MAQSIVQSIRTDRSPKQSKINLEDLPEEKQTDRRPKIIKFSERKYPRPRAGAPQPGINLYGKPKIIKDGSKCK